MVQQTSATSKIELVGKWFQSESDPEKSYLLLTRKSDGIAVDCNCGDRVYRGRKAHRPCKHMRKFNTRLVLSMLAEWMNGFAVIVQEVAAAKAAQVETVSVEEQALAANRVGTVAVNDVLGEAQAAMEQFDRDCDPNAYDVLATTKKMSTATYGTCGHLVKPGHEGDICGGCYQRMYM